MPRQRDARSYGSVFDEVAEDYDRHRPTYRDVTAVEAPASPRRRGRDRLRHGAATRAAGAGSGQHLIARARDQLHSVGDVQFVNARLEDASLPRAQFSAVFSASAIHWVDPDVSWRKAADALVDGGSLALVSYFGLDDPRSADDQQALRAAMATVAPELAADWPIYRDLARTLAGVAVRRANVSEVWAWLGGYEIACGYAADLFDDAQLAAVPTLLEQSADEVNALLGTMSFWARMSPRQRDALAAENQTLHQRLGRPIRSSAVACLVVARRQPRP